MKQKILHKRGALQESFGEDVPILQVQSASNLNNQFSQMYKDEMSANARYAQQSYAEEAYPSYVDMHNTGVNIPTIRGGPPVGGVQSLAVHRPQLYDGDVTRGRTRMSGERTEDAPFQGQTGGTGTRTSGIDSSRYGEFHTMFRYTVPEGQKVLVFDRQGRGTLVVGPQRILTWGKRIEHLTHHVAYPGEFLIVRHRDGHQEHLPGPCEIWFDPRIHVAIEKEDALQIAAKEAVVAYSRDKKSGDVHQRIARGPAVFVPQPGEWLHTFSWHGTRGDGYRKVPGALVFQKLWLMPDQMYHDVEDVRTADDVVLTVRLMIFFELINLERMLDETHDPIGDFINAASSDVLDLVGRYTFDDFKTRTELLNNLDHYSQLRGRAQQVGYQLHKIVYRGYSTSHALEAMHGQAIETRTRLKLERETENQAQELADFKQHREAQRAVQQRNQEKAQELHDMEKLQHRHEQQLRLTQERRDAERAQVKADTLQQMTLQKDAHQLWLDTLQTLKDMGVDLSAYLTQGRADQVIELRGNSGSGDTHPHLHLAPSPELRK